jgi:DNA-binding IclR family transcriptional regulator
LANATAGSVLTSVLRDGQAFVVDTVPGGADPIATVRPGMRLVPQTAAAMALLDPPPPTGLAVDDRTVLPELTCVAAPVHTPNGAVVASVCVMMVRLASIRPVADAVRGAVRQAELALRRQARPGQPDPAGPRWLLGM